MVWRVGGLLVVSGVVFDLTLNGAFIVLGFFSILAGAILVGIQFEASRVAEHQAVAPTAADVDEPARGHLP